MNYGMALHLLVLIFGYFLFSEEEHIPLIAKE